MGGACRTCCGEERCVKGFGGKPEGKRPLGRPRHRWEDLLRRILEKVDGDMNCIDLAEDKDRWRAFVNAVMNLRVT